MLEALDHSPYHNDRLEGALYERATQVAPVIHRDGTPKRYFSHLMQGVVSTFTVEMDSIRKRLIREYPETPEEEIDLAIHNYRIFLEVCKLNPGGYIIPNVFGVDEVWHAHILNMEKYIEDNYHFFGYVLMHRPLELGDGNCNSACEADHCSRFINKNFFLKNGKFEPIHK